MTKYPKKQYQITINGVRQSVDVSPLTELFFGTLWRGGFQAACSESTTAFWKEYEDSKPPEDLSERVMRLCERYKVTIPELLRTCISWHAGFKDLEW